MATAKPKAAAAARVGGALAARKRGELLGLLRPCFVRCGTWLQAGKYVSGLASDLPARNGWTIAQQAGDRTPQRMQRLLNRAVWDAVAAMGVVRRFAVTGLDEAARRGGRRRGLRIGAIDETSQVKQGCATAGVKRQYLGCVGKMANGITTVHLSYVREGTGHALIGARQWIPREQVDDPVKSLVTGLPLDLRFRTKGQLAVDILAEARADGITLDYLCGDEVHGACTELRKFCEAHGQGYVLRVPSNYHLTLAAGVRLTCAQAVTRPPHGTRWEVRSAGAGSKGQRWYAWALLATASPRHHLLIRRHLGTGELAFCYCFGLDQSQVRLYQAITCHTALVMAALAICAVTAALLRDRTGTQAPPPHSPDQPPPPDPGMIPLTVPQVKHLLAALLTRPRPPSHGGRWLDWKRRHQARSRWYHQRARLARDTRPGLQRARPFPDRPARVGPRPPG